MLKFKIIFDKIKIKPSSLSGGGLYGGVGGGGGGGGGFLCCISSNRKQNKILLKLFSRCANEVRKS
jgi:galactokinase/mevalonate kinase-like predicted kinase